MHIVRYTFLPLQRFQKMPQIKSNILRILFVFVLAVASRTVLNAGPSAISLSATPSPAIYGTPVVLTATINPPDATGTVTFYYGFSVAGVAPIHAGIAALTTSDLAVGVRPLTAYYSGNGVYTPATSTPPVSLTV